MEFKACSTSVNGSTADVLIESDWNLKDIENEPEQSNFFVLIESDWNLKRVGGKVITRQGFRINRIRLEFKGTSGGSGNGSSGY